MVEYINKGFFNTGDILNFNNTGTGGSNVSATTITNASGVITGITLLNAGSGYNIKAPTTTSVTPINNNGGTGANISCSLVPTSVANIVITASGTGYSTSPAFVFTPSGGGAGVSATPTITNCAITGLNVVSLGAGYNIKAPITTSITSAFGAGANITFNLLQSSVAS